MSTENNNVGGRPVKVANCSGYHGKQTESLDIGLSLTV